MTSPVPDRRRLLFEAWAPPESPWSVWAKPVLFAQGPLDAALAPDVRLPTPPSAPAFPEPGPVALILDVPGVLAVQLGRLAAEQGYQPVPLFNTTHGRSAIIDVLPLVRALGEGAAEVAAIRLPPTAPPAFLLDADRLRAGPRTPGKFDNRRMVFPQDFPSAARLLSADTTEVRILQDRPGELAADLRAVARLWQRSGLRITVAHWQTPAEARELPRLPRVWLGWITAFATASLGLRRSSAGGFGSVIPHPSQG